MRAMTKILLSACTVCALGQARNARGDNQVPGPGQSPPPQLPQPNQVPPPPTPTDVPGHPPNPKLPDPGAPTPSPTDDPANPVSPPPATPITPAAPTTPTPDTTPPTPDTTPPVPAPSATPTASVAPDEPADGGTDLYSYAWSEAGLPSGIGISAILGGGVTGFTDKTMRDTTSNVGGMWDLRVTIGSHLPLALDISYLGSATNINGLPTGNKGTLIGTTVEGAARFNVLPHFAFTPYVFGGIGWQRYDVTQTTVSLSDGGMNAHDNLLEFPLGAGFAYRAGGFVADLRGTFRIATDQNLVLTTPTLTPTSSDFAPMHTWEASAALGYEF